MKHISHALNEWAEELLQKSRRSDGMLLRYEYLKSKLQNEYNITETKEGKPIWECSLQELEDELWRVQQKVKA